MASLLMDQPVSGYGKPSLASIGCGATSPERILDPRRDCAGLEVVRRRVEGLAWPGQPMSRELPDGGSVRTRWVRYSTRRCGGT